MGDAEQDVLKMTDRARLYLMGDTGTDPEPAGHFGPSRMTRIAMRRASYLQSVEHEAAMLGWTWLHATPVLLHPSGLPGAVEPACSRVMDRATVVSRAAALDATCEESYREAARRGCARVQVAVAESLVDVGGRNIRRVLDQVGEIVLDNGRWHAVERDQGLRL